MALRSPDTVMRLARMGAGFPTRLSFMRSLIRRMNRERWRIVPTRFELDDDGYGTVVYTAITPERRYSLIGYSQYLEPDRRTDRVIAEAWDTTFALFDGEPSAADVARLTEQVPKQEAGRCRPSELVLSRANKSQRLFDYVIDALGEGRQPDPKVLGEVGYLMRTTAVYGNGKFGTGDRLRYADRPELAGPFRAELLTVYLIRCFTIDLVEHVARRRNPDRFVPLDRAIKRGLGIGNATGLGMAPFLISHPELIHNWLTARAGTSPNGSWPTKCSRRVSPRCAATSRRSPSGPAKRHGRATARGPGTRSTGAPRARSRPKARSCSSRCSWSPMAR